MTGDTDAGLEQLQRALRTRLRGDAAGDISLTGPQVRSLLDELGRLRQSNDRLRRQNRRVRLALQRATGAPADADENPRSADEDNNEAQP